MTNSILSIFTISDSLKGKLLCLNIVAIFSVNVLPSVAYAQENSQKIVVNDLEKKGKQFRAEVESAFMKMSKADARRTYDLIDVCNKYFHSGMGFDDVEVVLLAAGTLPAKPRIILVPAYNHSLPVDSPDRGDVGSGFLLKKSLISNAIFDINFRPDASNKAKLGKVMSCGVISSSL